MSNQCWSDGKILLTSCSAILKLSFELLYLFFQVSYDAVILVLINGHCIRYTLRPVRVLQCS